MIPAPKHKPGQADDEQDKGRAKASGRGRSMTRSKTLFQPQKRRAGESRCLKGWAVAFPSSSSSGPKDDRVEQANFDTYQMLRMDEGPAIELHIVQSFEPPGGMGEA
jgi:hypothetical protein